MLFETLPPETGRLFLWRSVPSVVIGKNQIPWRECDPNRIESGGGIFARRQTGGGAVYHDPGNLCYSLMMPRDGYDPDVVGNAIAAALRPLGLNLTVGPRHVLLAGDRKVSGTAFCYRRQRVLHHGTLLADADLNRLQDWLTPALIGIEGKGVTSVPSPVVNLCEIHSGFTTQQLFSALASVCGSTTVVAPNADQVIAEQSRFSHDQWRYGLTPAFSLATLEGPIACRRGLVEQAPPKLSHLVNQPFSAVLHELTQYR